MLPSQTVENYLKAIFQAQTALPGADALVPMGQLASALGVVPGTATTMVKALAEGGLVRYEPYAGVRLTAAGEKLAALVLRRHRLIELFLVKVMGMSWTEVHDEAENLEHAVSDRLIDRIDEMLGRPEVDPHGDPIPDSEGTVRWPAYDTLLTCPVGQPVRVSRVSDQDRDFLQFVERHDLKPGAIVRVEERDPAADSVRLRGAREFTIGTRAASKVLVQVAGALILLLTLGRPAFSPRFSVILPTGGDAGDGSPGIQINLPFSKQQGAMYWHWNAGITWLPKAEAASPGREESLEWPFLSGSGIYRVRPMLHLMLESVLTFNESIDDAGTGRDTLFTLSPGVRGGWNIGDHQLIAGLAVPITWGAGTETGVFGYLSYELPFK
jgi:DtxR family Mn-dependent transcriptional regulator